MSDTLQHQVKEVLDSYHRCRSSGTFIDTFYECFLGKSDEVRQKFAETDFVRQKRMLRQSLMAMLTMSSGVPTARDEVERLGVLHGKGELDVGPRLYELWLDALCESVARHDPEYRPELDGMWRRTMQEGIDLMISLYEG